MDVLLSVTRLISAALVVAGGFIGFNALWKMFENRSKNTPGDDSEWWKLLEGVMLAAVGASDIITTAIQSLHF